MVIIFKIHAIIILLESLYNMALYVTYRRAIIFAIIAKFYTNMKEVIARLITLKSTIKSNLQVYILL